MFDLFLSVLIAIPVTMIIWLGWRIPRLDHASLHSHNHTLTHSHTLLITCTCCYDQIKGTQDKDFSFSFPDSLFLAHFPCFFLSCSPSLLASPLSLSFLHSPLLSCFPLIPPAPSLVTLDGVQAFELLVAGQQAFDDDDRRMTEKQLRMAAGISRQG